MPDAPRILFTAFEPSGDALAARVIATLRQREPHRAIHALGGPLMREAGAQLIEETTGRAAMLAGAVAHAAAHRKRLKTLATFLREHPLAALVPVDSPAANWSVCKLVRRTQPDARIIHLVAPQLWAWAPWRIGRMRKLSDGALCVLPFEPDYFNARGVRATFVGHPLFDPPPQPRTLEALPDDLPRTGSPRLALLPGSRIGEIRANLPTMLEATRDLRHHHPHLEIIIAASSPENATLIARLMPALKRVPPVLTQRVDDILDWCDAALVVSGTATLHVASRRKPMVVLYNVSRVGWWAARWMIRTRTFTLPNLLGEWLGLGRIVPELVPHFGDPTPVFRELDELLRSEGARTQQIEAFSKIAATFQSPRFSEAAPNALLESIAG